eukprot:c2740_g1_i1.p2 GENE.c2740_g1_i1~~c2740_g1_i1.p2  ORF type:complete len:197 (+),score=41.28 c2740_g1_i1:138-728(+)
MAQTQSSPSEFKLCVCGPGGVGKTALTIQFFQREFVEVYDPTIEDNYRKQCLIEGQVALLDVLDTAGQEEYTALRSQYMRTGHGFLLVYSVTSRNSFDEILQFRQQIERAQDKDNSPMILVATKSDLDKERQVTVREGKALADSLGIPFVETSARERRNVEAAFETLVHLIRVERAKVTGKSQTSKKRHRPECVIL